jgi:hypothetical protein
MECGGLEGQLRVIEQKMKAQVSVTAGMRAKMAWTEQEAVAPPTSQLVEARGARARPTALGRHA